MNFEELWGATKRTLLIFVLALALIMVAIWYVPPQPNTNPGPRKQQPIFDYELTDEDPGLIKAHENWYIWRVNETSNMTKIIPFQIIRTGRNYDPIMTRAEIIAYGDYTNANMNITYTTLDMNKTQFESEIMTFAPGTFNISVGLVLDNRSIEAMELYHSTLIIIELYTNTGWGTKCGVAPSIFEERFDILIEKHEI